MLHIVLYRPEIAANTGNIMRTASVIGAQLHIIGPHLFPLYRKELARAALDYSEQLTYFLYDDYDQFIKKRQPQQLYLITRYGRRVYSDVNFPNHDELYIMFGSESSGIPRQLLIEHQANTLRIPMKPAARSLNLANSVAIVSYEVLRQWKFKDLALVEVLKGSDYLS